jgi:regulator of sigma E protease
VTTILAFALVLGVLVFVHELGHFLAAKRIGVRVLKFQLGFNPTVWSFRKGDTEYGIGAIPLGGYVKMAGESSEEPLSGKSDEFLSKSKWQRFQVMVMGPVMNLLTAIVLTVIVLAQGAEVPVFQSQPPVVGSVVTGSAAERAGIHAGDRIVSVAGHDVNTWEDFFLAVGSRLDRDIAVAMLRDGKEVSVRMQAASADKFDVTDIGVMPNVHPHVSAVTAGEPAAAAGLKAGDLVLRVDGQIIALAQQLSQAIARKPEMSITVTVRRGSEELDIHVTPARRGNVGRIGVQIGDQVTTFKPSLPQAVQMSFKRNYDYALVIGRTVWGLLTRETSPKQLMGPVAIAQLSGESARAGWMSLLSLMAAVSLNLGLLNLLPIPVLDGGHILIMALEGLVRRDFSARMKERMLLAGFVLLMVLMVTVIYNDLTRIAWIENLMPWR